MELTKEIVESIPDKALLSLRDTVVRKDWEMLKDVLEGEVLRRMGKLAQISEFQEKLAQTGHVPESPEAAALLNKLGGRKKKRHMSAAGRKAISDASKRRWAEFHRKKAADEKAASAKKKK